MPEINKKIVTNNASSSVDPPNFNDKNHFSVTMSEINKKIETNKTPSLIEPPNLSDDDYFSVIINGKTIYLGDYEKDIVLHDLIGEPLFEEVEEINKHGIDCVKKVLFDGIMIQFVRLGKDKPYFVDLIEVSDPIFLTGKGLRIGDDISKAKDIYPFLPLKEEIGIYSYAYPLNHIEFDTLNSKITGITIYESWP